MGNCLSRQTNTPGAVVLPNTQFVGIGQMPGEQDTPPSYEEAIATPTAPPVHQQQFQRQIPPVQQHFQQQGPPVQPQQFQQQGPPVQQQHFQQQGSSGIQQPPQAAAVNQRLLVAAIDFGTTFSGYAFSFRHEYAVDPLKISCNLWQHSNGLSNKAPTAVLIGPDLQVKSFGYDAERDYADIVQQKDVNNWYYFDRFKMKLFDEKQLTVDTKLLDICGKEMPAIDVFSGVIGYIKTHLLTRLRGMDTRGHIAYSAIHWVITVPAIWNDKAKQFMRKSAEKAGIPKEQLTLALEPEAASLFCRCLPTFHAAAASGNSNQYQPLAKGTKYMILDLGGGTADVTVHEILPDGTLQELHQASGGYWGGTTVDKKFYNVLKSVFGKNIIKQFRKQHPHDMLELQTEFEIKKRTFTLGQTKPVILRIPIGFVEVYEEMSGGNIPDAIEQSQYHDKIEMRKDKMIFQSDLFSDFFEGSVSCISSHIQELIQKPGLSDISIILLVGGYSESPVVKNTIINKYPNIRVVHPDDSGLAVLKGAVLFGHEPRAISSRVCKYTYGIAMTLPFKPGIHPEERRRQIGGISVCDDIYDIHLRIGQKVKLGENQPEREYRLIPGQTKGILEVFATSKPNPRFVSEEGCIFLGSVYIENDGGFQNNGKIFVKLVYGGTELGVEAREEKTGKTFRAYCDFLG